MAPWHSTREVDNLHGWISVHVCGIIETVTGLRFGLNIPQTVWKQSPREMSVQRRGELLATDNPEKHFHPAPIFTQSITALKPSIKAPVELRRRGVKPDAKQANTPSRPAVWVRTIEG